MRCALVHSLENKRAQNGVSEKLWDSGQFCKTKTYYIICLSMKYQFMSPPAISTVFPILYLIIIRSILNIRSSAFEKYTPSNSHAKVYSIGLSFISTPSSSFIHYISNTRSLNYREAIKCYHTNLLKQSLNQWLHLCSHM